MSRFNQKIPFHYGWLIAFCGFLTLFSCLGLARFAYGMLLPSMRAGLDLAYSQMGFISTGNFSGYLLSVALAPLAIRKFRPRSTIVFGLLLIAFCMFGISRADAFTSVLVLYTLIGVGSGFANIPAMVLVAHWFRRQRRGRAAGAMIMGNGSAIVFAGYAVPLLSELQGGAGWRSGWLMIGMISLLIAVIVGFLLRNDPADLGLEPVGQVEPINEQELTEGRAPSGGKIVTWLGLIYLVFGATYVIYGTFIVTTMVDEYSFSEARAGFYWSWVGLFSIFSGIGFGTLSDHIGRKKGLATVYVIQTIAYVLVGSGIGSAALVVSIVLYGLSAFAIPTIMAAAVGDYLPISQAAAAFSAITFFFAVGQTVGPAVAGILAESSGTFSISYQLSAALTALAVVMSILLPRPGSGGR
ncbi:MAG: MFS transporter [Desulfuromonas sp.]|nr:MAG: MFS transporter [Desulfuromonas sp.]